RARHSVANQWDLVTPLGIAPPEPARDPVEMTLDASAAADVASRLSAAHVGGELLVVIHVSAGNPFRRWPLEHFVDLIARVCAPRGRRVLVTSGPSEREARERVIEGARARLGAAAESVLDVGELSLDELRAVCDRAALYIGGDSGPLHVASTTTVPIVA